VATVDVVAFEMDIELIATSGSVQSRAFEATFFLPLSWIILDRVASLLRLSDMVKYHLCVLLFATGEGGGFPSLFVTRGSPSERRVPAFPSIG
jgi:hypothetical protein